MRPAQQPIWKLDTMFLALATAVLILSWMAHPRDEGDGAAPAGKAVAQLSAAPDTSRH